MKLYEVKTKDDIKEFHRVVSIIYKNNPNWVAYLENDIEKVFNVKHNKLYAEGGESIRWILKDDNGQLIGRVAAFVNPRTKNTTPLTTGGMGFFECINDKAAAFYLFDNCKNWLEDRGMEAMDGPINFGDRNQFWGCMTSNFDNPAVYQMNYNPEYYSVLFEEYGFGTYFNQLVFWRSLREPTQAIFHRKYQQVKDNPDLVIKNIHGVKLSKVAEDFRTVYNGAWGGHSHFKPMPASTAQKIMSSLKPIIDRDIILFVYHKGEPIAFYVNIPELNELFKHVNGKMNWWGIIKFLFYKYTTKRKRMIGLVFGVVKAWQGKGIEAALIVHGEKFIVDKLKYEDTVLTWIGDFNPKMLHVTENLGASLWRTYKTYRFQFDRTIPFERAPIVE
jgi:hypothetical protein